MHKALWELLWFDIQGSFKGLLSARRNWRQAVLLVLMLMFVVFFVGLRFWSPGTDPSGRFGPAMPFWALLYLLATWLTASADRGLVMRPAEIHFVVGGPFPDRDVITLNLVRLAFRALISAMVLSLLALAYVDSYLSTLFGMWMLISVSLLVGMIASLSARKAHRGIVSTLKRIFSVGAIVVLLALIYQSMQAVRASGQPIKVSIIAASALHTPVGEKVLPPLAWLFSPMASTAFFPDTLKLLPSRLAVVFSLVALVYLLGGRYLEASTRRTDLSISKRQNALRSGISASGTSWTKRLTLPAFGRLGGVGSVAWMQMLHSIRVLPRFLLFTCTILGVVLVIPLMMDHEKLSGYGAVGWMTGLTSYADFLLLLQLPVGFLGPISQREMLKSLPIPSWRIVLGQLAGPVIPLGVLHLAVAILFLYLVPQDWALIGLMSVALLPVALIIIANINLLGAWNIIRPRALQQRDALAAGRAMASVWIFFLMLTPAIVMAAISSLFFALLLGPQLVSYVFGASLGALLCSPIYIALLTRSFHYWQPSSAEGGKEETEFDR